MSVNESVDSGVSNSYISVSSYENVTGTAGKRSGFFVFFFFKIKIKFML